MGGHTPWPTPLGSCLHETPALLQRAAAIKATHPLSVADAWVAACAIDQGAILIHKDPEFKVVPVLQELLPGNGP